MKIIAKQFSHKLGFTLVEMLTALAIIAVLVSLIIPSGSCKFDNTCAQPGPQIG